MKEAPMSQKNADTLYLQCGSKTPKFARSLNEWCTMLITQICEQINKQVPIYLQNNLQNTCPRCTKMQECTKERTKFILNNPNLNSPDFILYSKDNMPENIKNYLLSHSRSSVREYEWYLVFKLPRMIDFYWDKLFKRASAYKQGEDGKITLKKYAGPIELPALKLNALIKDIFWDLIDELKKVKHSDFALHRINERGEHCGEYYYLLAVESKV